MNTWEYQVERFMFKSRIIIDSLDLRDWLNHRGAQGWEVVDMDQCEDCYVVTFKRPLESKSLAGGGRLLG